jgi:hypothetical protein
MILLVQNASKGLRFDGHHFGCAIKVIVLCSWDEIVEPVLCGVLPQCPVKADSALNFKFVISDGVFTLCSLYTQPDSHFAQVGCSLSS